MAGCLSVCLSICLFVCLPAYLLPKQNGVTALHVALYELHIEIAELLLRVPKIDVNIASTVSHSIMHPYPYRLSRYL